MLTGSDARCGRGQCNFEGLPTCFAHLPKKVEEQLSPPKSKESKTAMHCTGATQCGTTRTKRNTVQQHNKHLAKISVRRSSRMRGIVSSLAAIGVRVCMCVLGMYLERECCGSWSVLRRVLWRVNALRHTRHTLPTPYVTPCQYLAHIANTLRPCGHRANTLRVRDSLPAPFITPCQHIASHLANISRPPMPTQYACQHLAPLQFYQHLAWHRELANTSHLSNTLRHTAQNLQ